MIFKILSLDGGGSWAVLQLLTLRQKYGNIQGRTILRDFDLVVANSGGSIVMAALCQDYTLDEAIDLFRLKENREKIFYKNRFKERYFPIDYLRLIGVPLGPKYNAFRKKSALEELLPKCKRRMDLLQTDIGPDAPKLVVCTYDALNNRAKMFRSYGKDDPDAYAELTQAIHGSSNAPVQYFDFPARFKVKGKESVFYELWDGALGGFNNPVTVGLIEAMKLKVPVNEISIVSLGTGNRIASMADKDAYWLDKEAAKRTRGLKWKLWKHWKPQIRFFGRSVLQQAKTILYQPPDWSNYVTHMILSGGYAEYEPARFIRLSPLLYLREGDTMPTELQNLLQQLYKLDMDVTEEEEVNLLFRCFDAWRDGDIWNHPIAFSFKGKNQLVYDRGQRKFSEALALWS